MIPGKMLMYMAGLALTTSATAQADSSDSQNGVAIGAGAQYAPRYSGSEKMRLQVVPFFQAREDAFFADARKGIGYDLQSDSGLYLEHTLGYNLGRDDKDSDWRDGASSLKGMGKIRATVNTALAAGWQFTPGSALRERQPCRSAMIRVLIIRPPSLFCRCRVIRTPSRSRPRPCLATHAT